MKIFLQELKKASQFAKVVLFSVMVFGIAIKGTAQLSLTNAAPSATIDFSNTMQTGVGTTPSTAYTAAGFSPAPTTAGRLNSNAWALTGWSDGALAFGGTNTAGDYARGAVSAAQSTGGTYSYTGTPGSAANPTLMVQPGGSDFAPGTITLKIVNNGTTNITQLTVSYNLYVRNDQARSNSFNFSHSADNTTYTAVSALDYTSTAALDALGWVIVGTAPSRSTTITGITVTPGSAYYIRWSSADVGGSGSRDEFGLDDIAVGATFASSTSSVSDIAATSGFTYPQNIAYGSFQATSLTDLNSVEVARFDIRDGGSTASDADALATTLTAISFSVTNPASIRRIALFDGTTKLGEVAGGATASFSSLSAAAADNGTKTLSLRVSFLSSVTDNQQFSFTVSSATASTSGSGFAASNAGAATTSVAGDNNRIEVTATDLLFDVEPSTVSINAIMSPSPSIVAVDGNVNTDLDFTGPVSLSTTGTFAGGATTSVAAVNGVATFSNLIFSAEGTGVTIAGSASGVNATGNSTAFNVTNPQPEINIQQGGTDVLSGGSYDFGNQLSGTSSAVVTFTIQNTGSASLSLSGTPKVNISGANAGEFSIDETTTSASVAASGTTSFTITFSPTSLGGKSALISITNNDNTENPYTFSVSGTANSNNTSDIISTAGYTYTSNVDYLQYQSISSLATSTSVGVQGITIRDGGAAADADNLATTFTTIDFSTGGSTAIRTAALFDGGVNIAETAVNGGTLISFSGLNISAADGGTHDLELRVTYQSAVTDNQQIVFTVTNVVPGTTGSTFAAGNAGGAASTATADINRIEVAATVLAFVQQPTNSGINVAMSPAVTVAANDANGNRDLDFTEQVRITSTGTLSGSPADVAAVAGLATFSSLTHTVSGTGLVLSAERTATADWDIASSTFNVTAVTSASDFFRSNVATGNWNTAASWESSADGTSSWMTSTLVPGTAANTITIRSGHNITINSATTADQVVIANGGTLTHTSNLTVANGTGDDVVVENGGTFIYTAGPTYSTGATVRVNAGGVLSVRGGGLTGNGAGVNAATHIYDNASILEWNIASASPSSSGVTFFPNADVNTVPVLRFATGTASAWGAAAATTVNGKLEVASGVTLTLTGAGAKTFRNGIRGAGSLTQSTAGQIAITGTAAELGGAGTLTLGTSGLSIAAASTTSLSSAKTIAGTGTTTVAGILNLNGFTLTSVALAGAGTISGSATSGLVLTATTGLSFTSGSQLLKTLTVNSGTTTLSTPLSITAGASAGTTGTVTVVSGATLASAGNLTLRSNEFGTARVASGNAAGGYITGNVTVERYIPNNGFRSWRLLSVPTTTTQTIRQAWQEGNANPNPKDNNIAGYGTQITGAFPSQAAATAVGFDSTSTQAAMLTWNGTTWSNVTSTNQPINNNNSYFLYIRGDRSQTVAGTTGNTSATTLRTTGTLYTGDQVINVAAGSFALIPNLHASAINFSALDRTGGVNNLFYVWDSKKLNGNSLGAYQTFSATNGFQCTLGGGSYVFGQANTTIESGQSFFVTGGSGGTITLNESAKIDGGANLGFRPIVPADKLVKIDSRLYAGNEIADANVVVFDNAYPVTVGAEDAVKFTNSGINFAVAQQGTKLAIEGRPVIAGADVIEFNMWNLKQQQYHFEFVPNNMGLQQLEAVLEDSYLHTSTPVSLNENTVVNFTVDANAASAAINRFRIVFRKGAMLPAASKTGFVVSPNPVEGKLLNARLTDLSAGRYTLRLISSGGQVVTAKAVTHAGGNSQLTINLPSTVHSGTYNLEVIAPDKTKSIQQVFVK